MISKMKLWTGAAALMLAGPFTAMPAAAQDSTEETPAADDPISPLPVNIPAEQRKFFDMLAKFFEVKDKGPIDPARLALAERAVGSILPGGSLARMMDDMADRLLTPLTDLTSDMATFEISAATGIYDEAVLSLDQEKRKAVTLLLDPARKKRLQHGFNAIKPLIYETMAQLEGPMRAGMSRAYARKFDEGQLAELNRFFASPTGARFAAELFALQNDPEVWQAMFAVMPRLVENFAAAAPGLDKQVKALPKARSVTDLDDAELSRLAELLAVPLQTVTQGRDALGRDTAASAEAAAEAEAAETAAANDPFSGETLTEPWYDEANWSEAERANVDRLWVTYQDAADKSSETFARWEQAFNAALNTAREKYKAQGWKAAPASDAETAATDSSM